MVTDGPDDTFSRQRNDRYVTSPTSSEQNWHSTISTWSSCLGSLPLTTPILQPFPCLCTLFWWRIPPGHDPLFPVPLPPSFPPLTWFSTVFLTPLYYPFTFNDLFLLTFRTLSSTFPSFLPPSFLITPSFTSVRCVHHSFTFPFSTILTRRRKTPSTSHWRTQCESVPSRSSRDIVSCPGLFFRWRVLTGLP